MDGDDTFIKENQCYKNNDVGNTTEIPPKDQNAPECGPLNDIIHGDDVEYTNDYEIETIEVDTSATENQCLEDKNKIYENDSENMNYFKKLSEVSPIKETHSMANNYEKNDVEKAPEMPPKGPQNAPERPPKACFSQTIKDIAHEADVEYKNDYAKSTGEADISITESSCSKNRDMFNENYYENAPDKSANDQQKVPVRPPKDTLSQSFKDKFHEENVEKAPKDNFSQTAKDTIYEDDVEKVPERPPKGNLSHSVKGIFYEDDVEKVPERPPKGTLSYSVNGTVYKNDVQKIPERNFSQTAKDIIFDNEVEKTPERPPKSTLSHSVKDTVYEGDFEKDSEGPPKDTLSQSAKGIFYEDDVENVPEKPSKDTPSHSEKGTVYKDDVGKVPERPPKGNFSQTAKDMIYEYDVEKVPERPPKGALSHSVKGTVSEVDVEPVPERPPRCPINTHKRPPKEIIHDNSEENLFWEFGKDTPLVGIKKATSCPNINKLLVKVEVPDVQTSINHPMSSYVNRAPSLHTLSKIPNEVGKQDVSLNSIPAKLMHRISSIPLRNLLGTKKTAEPQMSELHEIEIVDPYQSNESNVVNIYEEVAPTLR